MLKNQAVLYTTRRVALILAGSVLMAFDINTFVHAGGLIPGGFNGLTILIQEICARYGGFRIPFSVVNYTLNAVPAVICFRFIGKKFALYSCLMIIVSGLLTDWMPAMFIDILQIHDVLLSAIFGGLLNAVAISLCLYADATSGGTDFIAVFISEKYRKDAWNYIFAGNCVILAVAGFLFSLDKALYSIIFQFTTTAALGALYHSYQQKTLLVITSMPEDVYQYIHEKTGHGATSIEGMGHYEKKKRVILYSVVSANEAAAVVRGIMKIDPKAFVNVIKTEQINGLFTKRPRD
jgi:uncharacterized membrane-anchored protein YitT (DUF2179 family)